MTPSPEGQEFCPDSRVADAETPDKRSAFPWRVLGVGRSSETRLGPVDPREGTGASTRGNGGEMSCFPRWVTWCPLGAVLRMFSRWLDESVGLF